MQANKSFPSSEIVALIDSLRINVEVIKTAVQIMHPSVCEILDVEGIERDLQIAVNGMWNARVRLETAWMMAINLNGDAGPQPEQI